MIEFIVGIVAILALFAGLIQFVSLFTAQTDTLAKARSLAGMRAMSDVPTASAAEYIKFWDEADDERRYSADDTHTEADPVAFMDTIAAKAGRDAADWQRLSAVPRNEIRDLRNSGAPATMLGLEEGRDSKEVFLLPAVRHLLYDKSSIEIEGVAWLPWCRGIY